MIKYINTVVFVFLFQMKGKLLCWLCTMSYKRAIAKSMKAKEFTKSVSDQTRRRRHKEGAVGSKQAPPSSEENAPYSPSMGLAGATDSQESTPYSPGVDLGIFLGGDDRDSLTGNCLRFHC